MLALECEAVHISTIFVAFFSPARARAGSDGMRASNMATFGLARAITRSVMVSNQ
jgi:hypothetical protein